MLVTSVAVVRKILDAVPSPHYLPIHKGDTNTMNAVANTPAISAKFVAYSLTDGRLLRDATADEVSSYTTANKARAERCPVRRAACFDEAVTVGDVRIDTYTGPGIWFGGAGF